MRNRLLSILFVLSVVIGSLTPHAALADGGDGGCDTTYQLSIEVTADSVVAVGVPEPLTKGSYTVSVMGNTIDLYAEYGTAVTTKGRTFDLNGRPAVKDDFIAHFYTYGAESEFPVASYPDTVTVYRSEVWLTFSPRNFEQPGNYAFNVHVTCK